MLYGPDSRPLSSISSPAPRQTSSARGYAFEHPFDAAKRTGFKGYFYFPTLEPSEMMPVQTRDIINKKAQWLYNNFDPVRVVIDALALEEVDGGIWPKARTENPDFNKAVTDDFDNICGDARFFHAAGTSDYFSGQLVIRKAVKLFGEGFGQMLRPSEGGSTPLLHLLNTWQCANANKPKLDQKLWDEGMRRNEFGRVSQYRFLTSRDGTEFKDVDANDVLHFFDPMLIGQGRQMSSLAPVVRKMFTADDIERMESAGALLRAKHAYALTRPDGSEALASLTLPGAEVEEHKQEDGTVLQIQKIQSDGEDVDVMVPPAGFDFKVLESNRPTIAIELLKWFLNGLANTSLYPPEYVFFLGGMGAGTVPRLVQNRVQLIKNAIRRFQLAPQFCKRWYIFWLWQRIKAGFYDNVPGGVPKDWFKVRLIHPANNTIDIGREGALWDRRLETGKISPAIYYGLMGEDDEDVEDEIISSAVRRAKKLAEARKANPDIAAQLADNVVFRPPAGAAPVVIDPSANEPGKDEDPDEDEDPPKKKK